MPAKKEENMYDSGKGKMAPHEVRYNAGERVLKQIQGGGMQPNGLFEANVTEHLLAAQASGQYDITSRVVARAISGAKTGGDLDIV